jgi:hypothetical protein
MSHGRAPARTWGRATGAALGGDEARQSHPSARVGGWIRFLCEHQPCECLQTSQSSERTARQRTTEPVLTTNASPNGSALKRGLRPCCGLSGRPGSVLSSRCAKLRRMIGSAGGCGGRLIADRHPSPSFSLRRLAAPRNPNRSRSGEGHSQAEPLGGALVVNLPRFVVREV